MDKTCDHEWTPFTDMPPYSARHYFQCVRCKVIGMLPHNGSNLMSTSGRKKVKPLTCRAEGCHNPAIGRNKGLRSGRIHWACDFHADAGRQTGLASST